MRHLCGMAGGIVDNEKEEVTEGCYGISAQRGVVLGKKHAGRVLLRRALHAFLIPRLGVYAVTTRRIAQLDRRYRQWRGMYGSGGVNSGFGGQPRMWRRNVPSTKCGRDGRRRAKATCGAASLVPNLAVDDDITDWQTVNFNGDAVVLRWATSNYVWQRPNM